VVASPSPQRDGDRDAQADPASADAQSPGEAPHDASFAGVTEMDWQIWLHRLGREMQKLRDALGLSQRDLARLSGVSQGAVSRFETGRGRATPVLVLLKIGAALTRPPRALDYPLGQAMLRLLAEAVRLARE
jgi:DNA-binding XRE family transcriptional regulator